MDRAEKIQGEPRAARRSKQEILKHNRGCVGRTRALLERAPRQGHKRQRKGLLQTGQYKRCDNKCHEGLQAGGGPETDAMCPESRPTQTNSQTGFRSVA